MRKQGTLIQDDSEMGDINISPMIDMVFILLIFFIVTTVFVEEPGVEVRREYAQKAVKLEKNSLLIAVTSSNSVVYGGSEVGVNGVQSIILRYLRDTPDMPVIIQADRECDASYVINVVDKVKMAGAKKVSISTEQR